MLAGILWLASGREVLTKPARVVSVTQTDPLFGDTMVVQEFVRGPVFGYYVGLDLVLAAALVSLVVAGVLWLLARHRAWRDRSLHEHPSMG
jgi:hypothetical protein